MNVLVVESSEVLRRRFASLVNDLDGVRVAREASTAPEALAHLRETPIDAVILDVDMPEGAGLTALQEIRRQAPACVLISVGGSAEPEIHERALVLGADFYFTAALHLDLIGDILEEIAERIGS